MEIDDGRETYTRLLMDMNPYIAAGAHANGLLGGDREIEPDARIYEMLSNEPQSRWSDDSEKPLAEFISSLHALANDVPSGADPVIKFGVEYGYESGDETAYYEVGYWRDPTEAEKAERRAKNAAIRDERKARQEAHDRAEFERLQAKFASGPKGIART